MQKKKLEQLAAMKALSQLGIVAPKEKLVANQYGNHVSITVL